MLCTEILNNLLTTLRAIPADVGSTFNVVVVSFDPREKPPLAAVKKANYLEQYGRAGAERGWRFLTGDPLAIATLADAVGFQYEYDPKTEQYAHASGIMVLSPDGTLDALLARRSIRTTRCPAGARRGVARKGQFAGGSGPFVVLSL